MLNALTRPLWRGRTNVDLMTITAIEQAERLAGFEFDITQGSYQGGGGDAKSAGTHDGGGVVDLRTRDLTSAQKTAMVRSLRRVGFAAWLRTPAQGFTEHVHAVLGGHPRLHPTAARQWDAYVDGRNGLKSNGRDDGPRITPIPTFNLESQEDDDMAINLDDLAKAVWNFRLTKDHPPMRVMVPQIYNRTRILLDHARNAERVSRENLELTGDLAKLLGDATLTEEARTALAVDIAARTAAAVERLDAEAVADKLEITVKED